MILPLLFLLGLAYASVKTMGKAVPNTTPQPVVGATRAGVIRVEHPPQPGLGRRYRTMLKARLSAGAPVTRWLVDNAMLEAFKHGDMNTVLLLARKFGAKKPNRNTADRRPPSEDTSEKQVSESESEPELGNEVDNHNQLSELGQPSLKSPLDGVADEDWMDFVARLRTKPPGFKSDKYLGQYEQNRKRLKQLGLPEPTNQEEEYETLAKDIATHAKDSAELVAQWSGDMVKVDGTEHPVCASGILGLLKYAGPEGAKSWLANPEDRAKYPKTTEAFLRTNNCF